MILWKLIQAHREELAIFGRLGRHGGFIEGLSRTITEMRSYRIDPQGLIGRTENDALSRKLQDLAMILERYDAHLQDRFTDPDAYLTAAANRLPGAGLEGCLIWVDGFAGFTPQELEMLGRLFLIAEQATVTLCLDSREVGKEDSPFRSTAETYIQLLRLAAERQVKIHPPIELAGQKRLRAPELAPLGKGIPQEGRQALGRALPGGNLSQGSPSDGGGGRSGPGDPAPSLGGGLSLPRDRRHPPGHRPLRAPHPGSFPRLSNPLLPRPAARRCLPSIGGAGALRRRASPVQLVLRDHLSAAEDRSIPPFSGRGGSAGKLRPRLRYCRLPMDTGAPGLMARLGSWKRSTPCGKRSLTSSSPLPNS
jgi:hypothetical protein